MVIKDIILIVRGSNSVTELYNNLNQRLKLEIKEREKDISLKVLAKFLDDYAVWRNGRKFVVIDKPLDSLLLKAKIRVDKIK
jgi:hypothetical protein